MSDSDVQEGGMPPAKKAKVTENEPPCEEVKDRPQSTESASTEPASAEPASAEPASAEPASTEPGSTEPASTFSASDDRYSDFVTPEEVQKLREFRVLDEVKSNDEDSNDDDSDSSTGESVDLPEEEIEKMLEENLPDGFKAAPKPKEKAYVTREKVILEEKGVNHFEVLPLDWIMIRHQSGMPVYVHRASRVCTLSKPYFLGKGNAKRHDIPISAIPCLSYRRALEEEEKQKLIDQKVEEQIKRGTWNLNNKGTSSAANGQEGQPMTNGNDSIIHSVNGMTVNENGLGNSTEVACSSSNTEVQQKKCPFKHGVSRSMSNEVDVEVEEKGFENNGDVKMIDNSSQDVKDSVISTADVEMENKDSNEANAESGQNENKNEPGPSDDTIEIPPNRQPIVLPGGIVMPSPRVETINTSWKSQHLTHEQVNEYCKKLFKFRVLTIMHFKRWADRRKYTKARKALQYPMLPEGTKLITIPVQSTSGQDNTGKVAKRDWVMNMNGRSYLSVFHEYVRRALQKQPVYEFKQLENASTPYQATVFIGGMQYGVGHGSSKRQAKSAAARASIQILIPEMRDHLEPTAEGDPDFVFFDYVGIEDPRIAEFCAATCEPTPHAILRTCLLRNFGAGDRHIHTEMKKLEYQKIELTMKVGKHSATVVCKNKKTAKQRASQAILQALHPHVRSWGSLLRLYGSRSVKSCKERKLEEQQITLLQDKARHNEPNHAVLDKLRREMLKLRERDAALAPVGTLLLPAPPAHAGSRLNDVEL